MALTKVVTPVQMARVMVAAFPFVPDLTQLIPWLCARPGHAAPAPQLVAAAPATGAGWQTAAGLSSGSSWRPAASAADAHAAAAGTGTTPEALSGGPGGADSLLDGLFDDGMLAVVADLPPLPSPLDGACADAGHLVAPASTCGADLGPGP